MNDTAAQLANALRAALPALDHSDYHEGPGPAEGAAAPARRALRAYERAAKQDAKKRNEQTAQPDQAELASALRALVKELNGPMRGYWTESLDNTEQAAREALAAYDRAQQPKPKGAPGLCPVCRHYGEDCTCYRRKGARHVRG